ncbi:MAG: 3-keto-5-aminohexanoate cleavage protein, partial [Thermomicrobiales bacterium]
IKEYEHNWEQPYLENSRDYIFKNTFADIEYVLKTLGEGHGVRFEFECYDIGHLYTLAHFLDRGLVKPPLFVQTIFGILGGLGTDPEDLLHMRRTADRLFGDAYLWSILGAGRHQMNLVAMGAIMGGNVRVGLEDSVYLGKGQLAETNADLVAKIRRILTELSIEIATPDDAREMLGLKGAANVGF